MCVSLLFAFAIEEPLVLNPPEEKYYSAFRDEMRTMDGVYHATIVGARMAASIYTQLASGTLDPELEAIAVPRMKQARGYFDKGLEEIEQKGRLTPLGESILDQAHDLLAPTST